MSTLSIPFIFWSTICVQLLALGAIVAVRLSPVGRRRLLSQQLFFASLVAMGLITLLSLGADSDSWVTTGATLSVITVCATFDFRRESRCQYHF